MATHATSFALMLNVETRCGIVRSMKVVVLSRLGDALKPARRRLRAWWLTLAGHREDAVEWLVRIVPGMFARDEIRVLYRTARDALGPGDIAEIGSWKGRTTVTMGLALRDAGVKDCRIYAIDHHLGSAEHAERIACEGSTLAAFRKNVRDAGVEDLVEEMVMLSPAAGKILRERGVRLRMAFIDGAHDEESVRTDIRLMLPLMRAGGILAFHDYEPGWPGVVKAFHGELDGKVDVVDRASSLLVARLRT
jgi:predicted O-methyltransferase YrrM